ncbi:hypothetical protein ASG92_22335 [Arthrobacter sp. Soil736]|uniref:hypothetical protein n=1 Tax=Arthrobacter sp. Soil736 TaxID=1736395 RepID=UPI0006FC0E79|nr:hypothetical protein [Arthrobacter sp. Soil736]KRE59374.1 hypothetical protein ASG92_22335 [Arthrobacter sp. Soil736]
MSEEGTAVSASGPAAAPKHVIGLIKSQGSAATRAMRKQARRRRDAEPKLQLHVLQTRHKPAG